MRIFWDIILVGSLCVFFLASRDLPYNVEVKKVSIIYFFSFRFRFLSRSCWIRDCSLSNGKSMSRESISWIPSQMSPGKVARCRSRACEYAFLRPKCDNITSIFRQLVLFPFIVWILQFWFCNYRINDARMFVSAITDYSPAMNNTCWIIKNRLLRARKCSNVCSLLRYTYSVTLT